MIEYVREIFDDVKLSLITFFVFLAWLVAATGWVRVLAVVWLLYPALFAWHTARHRSI
jgi:hypothetical protein